MSGKQSNTKISFAPYQAHPLILIAYQQAVRIFCLYTQAPIACAVITHDRPMGRLSASTPY